MPYLVKSRAPGADPDEGVPIGGSADEEVPPLENMLWWFKADAITGSSDGDFLFEWVDSSPNAFVGLSPGSNPGTALSYHTGVLNGLPIVRNNNSQDYLEIPYPNYSPVLTGTSFTGYWAGSYNNVQSGQGILLYNYQTAGQIALRLVASFDIGGSNGIGYEYDDGSVVDVFLGAGASGVQVLTWVVDVVGLQASVYRNSTLIASSEDVPAEGFGWGQDFIHLFGIGSNPMVGDHGEFLAYSVAHDEETREAVVAYLREKWGI